MLISAPDPTASLVRGAASPEKRGAEGLSGAHTEVRGPVLGGQSSPVWPHTQSPSLASSLFSLGECLTGKSDVRLSRHLLHPSCFSVLGMCLPPS